MGIHPLSVCHGTQGCIVHANYAMDYGFVPCTVVHGWTARRTTQEVTLSDFLRSPTLGLSIVIINMYKIYVVDISSSI
jgi:hypothetical protein